MDALSRLPARDRPQNARGEVDRQDKATHPWGLVVVMVDVLVYLRRPSLRSAYARKVGGGK